MWGRRRKLECLYEELKAIALHERLCDNGSWVDESAESDKVASIVRQKRQDELLAAIAKLNRKNSAA
jgi:hypothetical protein